VPYASLSNVQDRLLERLSVLDQFPQVSRVPVRVRGQGVLVVAADLARVGLAHFVNSVQAVLAYDDSRLFGHFLFIIALTWSPTKALMASGIVRKNTGGK
jgi:hypothetical protein